ncbi:unnamed protein product, partial [Didymodactylos carnosus]
MSVCGVQSGGMEKRLQ